MIGLVLPDTNFVFHDGAKFVNRTTKDLFDDKRAILLSLPASSDPGPSRQLLGFEEKYDEFADYGIDDIYCVSVNDGPSVNSWAELYGIKKVTLIPDGEGSFTRSLSEENSFLSPRSGYRYAMLVFNGVIETCFLEPIPQDDTLDPPYDNTTPGEFLSFLQTIIS